MIALEDLERKIDQVFEGVSRQITNLVSVSAKKLDPADSRDLRDCGKWLIEMREVLLKQLTNLTLEERKALLEKLKAPTDPA